MEKMILVPGPQGSRLTLNGEEIWPPTVEEMIFGYNRMDELLNQDVQVSTIVDEIEIFPSLQAASGRFRHYCSAIWRNKKKIGFSVRLAKGPFKDRR